MTFASPWTPPSATRRGVLSRARLALPLLFLSLSGCALATKPRPTPFGVLELEGGLGGPVAQFGEVTFPLPVPSVGARYGVSPRLDVQAHVHLAPLRWGGLGADLGSTALILQEAGGRPAVAVTGRAFLFTDFDLTWRPAAEAALHASWKYEERWMTFVSGGLIVDPSAGQRTFYAAAGQSMTLGALSLSVELRAWEPTFVNSVAALRFPRFFGYAPIGALLGVTYAFGGGGR